MKFLQFIFVLAGIMFLFSCNNDLVTDSLDDDDGTNFERKRSCSTHEHMSTLMLQPDFVKEYTNRLDVFNKVNNERQQKAACSSPIIIPVAVHYQGVNSPNRSCLVDLANRQIAVINADYAGTNNDITKWTNSASSYFSNVANGETCVKFVLANTNHPSGHGLQNGDVAVTVNTTNGDQVNQWSGYLNIFVQNNTGVLGYSPLGGSGNGDGVVIDASAFGIGSGCGSVSPESPYNLGRTLTHEVGHYFLLDHIWGNGCNVDDDVSDTPDQSSDYGGCPNIGATSCGSTDMHMNYMDYTNDACMYMFSNGQSNRMENYISANLGNLVSKATQVINGDTSGGGGDAGGGDTGGGDPEPSVCQTPENSTVSKINESKVKVDWEDISNASRYRIRYRIVGTSRWTAKNSSISQKTLTGLNSSATYEYQLRTKCPEGWTRFGAKQTFVISDDNGGNGGDSGSSETYRFNLILDDYGSETTWYILDDNYSEIYNGGPYQDGQSGKLITKEFTLSQGCYELELQDLWGDGICCEYGNGYAEILDKNGNQLAHLDGQFGTLDYIGFCVDGTGLRIIKRKRDSKNKSKGVKK